MAGTVLRQLFRFGKKFGVTLIGGDTTKGDMAFNVTIIGELPKGRALRRDAAVAGDDIWVSGRVGMAAAALNCRLKRCVLPDDVFAECEQSCSAPSQGLGWGLRCCRLPGGAGCFRRPRARFGAYPDRFRRGGGNLGRFAAVFIRIERYFAPSAMAVLYFGGRRRLRAGVYRAGKLPQPRA